MRTDSLGNAVTVAADASLAAVDDFVEGFIASEARAVNVLAAAAHDGSAIVQAYAAAVHMFAESHDASTNARPFIGKALADALQATPREQRFIRAVAAWVDGDVALAVRLHEEQAREFPRDLASLKLGQYHLFNSGDANRMLRIAMHAQSAANDVPYFHGMLAFGFEQCHRLEEAEASARRAIEMCRKEPWAHHALAHVMLTQGRNQEGNDFMQSVGGTWTGLNSFMVTHNWWHRALFSIELGNHDEALHLYDTQVWGVAKGYSQDQINAVSLLARLELAGVDVRDRWSDVGQYLAPRTCDHVLPFLDVQYLYGLARAGRDEADTLMANIEVQRGAIWQEVGIPTARAMLAHARRNYSKATEELGRTLPRMQEIGGSHAQRDLFTRIYRDAVKKLESDPD